jgi:hypothetical protein
MVLDDASSDPLPSAQFDGDNYSRGFGPIYLSFGFLALSALFTAVRIYTRLRVSRWFGSDDIFIGAALVDSSVKPLQISIADYHQVLHGGTQWALLRRCPKLWIR